MMLLNLPCLCRLDVWSPGPSPELRIFVGTAALLCIDSARKTFRLICESLGGTDPVCPIRLGPWWCIIHYAVSAEAVLLLELSFGAIHIPKDQVQPIFDDAEKLLWWLKTTNTRGVEAGVERCCVELAHFLQQLAPRFGREVPHDLSSGILHQQHPRPDPIQTMELPWSHPELFPLYRVGSMDMERHHLDQDHGGGHLQLAAKQHFFPNTEFRHEPGSSGYESSRM